MDWDISVGEALDSGKSFWVIFLLFLLFQLPILIALLFLVAHQPLMWLVGMIAGYLILTIVPAKVITILIG
jgi:hypothetical protein